MKTTFTILFHFFLALTFSQTETLAVFDSISTYGSNCTLKVYEDTVLMTFSKENGKKLVRVLPSLGEVSYLDNYIDYQVPAAKGLIYTEKGVYYQNSNKDQNGQLEYGFYVINYVTKGGVHTISEKFYMENSIYGAVPSLFFDNKYFYITTESNKYYLKYFDGETIETVTIFESDYALSFIGNKQDRLFFSHVSTNTSDFYEITPDFVPQLIESHPAASYFFPASETTQELKFFRQGNSLYKFDLNQANSTLILSGININRLFLDGSTLFLNNVTLKLDLNTNELDSVFFVSKLKRETFYTNYYTFPFGGNKFLLTTPEFGFEIAYLNNEDSLDVLNDLNKGAGSSFPYVKDFYGIDASKFYFKTDTAFYHVLTNGNDFGYYLYKIQNNNFQSLFKMENGKAVQKIFCFGNYVYWTELVKRKLYLKRRKLDNLDAPQPNFKDSSSLTWYREIALNSNTHFEMDDNLKADELVFDKEGNSYSTFYKSNHYINTFLAHDTLIYEFKNGYESLVKFDEKGNLKWLKKIGGKNPHFSERRLNVMSNGDLLLVGTFFDSLRYDNYKVTTPYQAVYAMQIDTESGEVKEFKKLITLNDNNYLELHQVVLDQTDNIYLSFWNRYESLTIENTQLTSSKEYENKIAKFDKEYNLIWVRNTPSSIESEYKLTSTGIKFVEDGIIQSLSGVKVLAIQKLDEQGDLQYNLPLTQTDNHGFSSIQSVNNQAIFGFGMVSESVSFDDFTFINPTENEKKYRKTYFFEFDSKLQKFNKLFVSGNRKMGILQSKRLGEFMYMLCPISEHYTYYDSILIIKFNINTHEVFYKTLNQYYNDASAHFKMDISDNYLIITGINFKDDNNFQVTNLHPNSEVVSFLKIANVNWISDNTLFREIDPVKINQNASILLYPNPFENEIYLKLYNETFERYEIFNASGQLVSFGNLNDELNQKIVLEGLRKGLYFIKFYGKGDTILKKVIKI
jgi:hypothetical protein